MSKDSFFGSVRSLVGARSIFLLLQFLSVPLLARLLSVDDFAIVALGMVIAVFANTFSDAGFGRSLIRAPRYDDDEWNTVFWFLVGVGIVLGLLVVLIAPIYAWMTNRPELFPVVAVLALLPLMQAVMSVPQAQIERAYRFGTISSIAVTAGVASVLTALGMAYLGFGYWALVTQQVLLVTFRMLGMFLFSTFQPRLVFRFPLLASHLNFGKNTLLFSIVMTVQNQLPVVMFNQFFGTLAVSLWSMSERISRFPRLGASGPLSQVTMVSMSRQWREGKGAAAVGQSYLSATRLLATVLFPGMIVLALNGTPVFAWFLSETWAGVALVFGLAVPGMLVDLIASLGARVFMVADRTDLRLRMAVERFLLGTVLFLTALPFGLEIAIGVRSLFMICYLPRYWSYINRCVPLSLKSEVSVLMAPAIVGSVVGIVAFLFLTPELKSDVVGATMILGLCLVSTGLAAGLTRKAIQSDADWLRKSPEKVEETVLEN